MSNNIKIDQIVGGNNAIRTDYITLDGYEDPSSISNVGILYAKEVDGYSELYYIDDYGNVIQFTNKGALLSPSINDSTIADISYYVNASTGDDNNDGLASDTPKQTLQAIFDIIPFHVKHNVDINAVGTFTDDAVLKKYVKDGYYINIDGGDGYSVIAGPYTSDAVGDNSISTATSTTDWIYWGNWIRMTSGVNENFIRSIYYNNSDVFYFIKQDMGQNVVGDTFEIVKPSTSIYNLEISCSGMGSVVVQRLYITSGYKIWSENCGAAIILTMIQSAASTPCHSFENCRKVEFASRLYSSGSFSSDPTLVAGVSLDAIETNDPSTLFYNIKEVSLSGAILSIVDFTNCGVGLINDGTIIKYKCLFKASRSIGGNTAEPHSFEDTPGYVSTGCTRHESSALGLELNAGGCIGVKDFYTDKSAIKIYQHACLSVVSNGILTGTMGAGTVGVLCQDGGVMAISDGAKPLTITGGNGDFSYQHGSELAAWTTIQGDTAAVNTNNMIIGDIYKSPIDSFKVFDFSDDSELPSVTRINPALTINSLTVYPMFEYNGKDATVNSWPIRIFGTDIPIAGSGSNVSINQGSPLIGLQDDSVKGEDGEYYQMSSGSTYDIGAEDFVVTVVLQTGPSSSGRIFDKRGATGAGYYLEDNGTNVTLYIDDGSDNDSIVSPTLIENTWYVLNFFMDKSGSGICYANTNAGSAVSISTTGNLGNSEKFTIFADSDGNNKNSDSKVAYIGIWKKQTWLDSHLQVAIDKEIFYKIVGAWPQRALGTEVPTICVRDSPASLRNNGTTYFVGEDWPRIEHITDAYGNDFKGYLSEDSISNLMYSNSKSFQSWSKRAEDTVSTDQVADPAGNITLDAMIADATDTVHYFSEAQSLSASSQYTYSMIMKAGNKDWGYLDSTTLTNISCYFNLSTGVVGTKGAGVDASGMIDLGNGLYRCWMTFSDEGASSETFRCAPAHADTDNDFSGDGSTKNTYFGWAQLEVNSFPSSFMDRDSGNRADDVLYYKGDDGNVSDSKGTLSCTMLRSDYINYQDTSDIHFLTLTDGGAGTNNILFKIGYNTKKFELVVTTDSSEVVAAIGNISICTNSPRHIVVPYELNNVTALIDGAPDITRDTGCTIPDDIDRITIGSDGANQKQFDGLISNVGIKKSFNPR
jgi:hypothetical protein